MTGFCEHKHVQKDVPRNISLSLLLLKILIHISFASINICCNCKLLAPIVTSQKRNIKLLSLHSTHTHFHELNEVRCVPPPTPPIEPFKLGALFFTHTIVHRYQNIPSHRSFISHRKHETLGWKWRFLINHYFLLSAEIDECDSSTFVEQRP